MGRVLAIGAVLVLGISSTALAKGPLSAEACGSSGCETTNFRGPFVPHLVLPPVFMRGGADPAPEQPAAWFNVRFRLGDNRWRVDDRCQTDSPPRFCNPVRGVFVLADGRYVGGRDAGTIVWERLNPAQAEVYADLTRGLTPLPGTSLPGAVQPLAPDEDAAVWPWVAGGGVLLIAFVGAPVVLRRWRGRADVRAARPQE